MVFQEFFTPSPGQFRQFPMKRFHPREDLAKLSAGQIRRDVPFRLRRQELVGGGFIQ